MGNRLLNIISFLCFCAKCQFLQYCLRFLISAVRISCPLSKKYLACRPVQSSLSPSGSGNNKRLTSQGYCMADLWASDHHPGAMGLMALVIHKLQSAVNLVHYEKKYGWTLHTRPMQLISTSALADLLILFWNVYFLKETIDKLNNNYNDLYDMQNG